MAISEKRVLLGVEKTKAPSKRSKKLIKKKHFIRKFADYLNSDSYLFAPLTSSRSLKNIGKAKEEERKIESETNLVKKVRDYLMTDSYLYASLLVAPPKSFYLQPKESQGQIKRVTAVEVTRKSITLKDKSLLANGLAKAGQAAANDSLTDIVIKDPKPQVQKETAKHAIYRKYRPIKDLKPQVQKETADRVTYRKYRPILVLEGTFGSKI